MRNETILHIVLNFQVDRPRFHGGEESANFVRKRNKKERKKERNK